MYNSYETPQVSSVIQHPATLWPFIPAAGTEGRHESQQGLERNLAKKGLGAEQ